MNATSKKPSPKQEIESACSVCGIVMPISAIDGYTEGHWLDVREILDDAITTAGFEAHLVSDANEVGIIQKRIVQNLYENPVVVCDVSGKNPNVMFELGMRLAFDKPTVIVKDDKTSYAFDTSLIEHLQYPRDLRYAQIVEFKEELAEKIRATYEKSKTDKDYTTFLKHFGTFKVAKLDTEEVSSSTLVLEELQTLRSLVQGLGNREKVGGMVRQRTPRTPTLCLRNTTEEVFKVVLDAVTLIDASAITDSRETRPNHFHILFDQDKPIDRKHYLSIAKKIYPAARWLD